MLILKLWNRLCYLDESRLTRKVFDWDRCYTNKRGTWCYKVRHLLSSIDCQELFNEALPCDIVSVKSKLDYIDMECWDINRYKSDKLRYYNLYKYDKSKESYLDMNITRYQRSLIAQFRCGILPLEVEVGRFRDVNLSDRLCNMCTLNVVENEIHF